MKECSKCKKSKDFSEFHKNKRSPDGYKPRCKDCRNEDNKEHREKNPEYYQKWREENGEYRNKLDREYRKKNKEKIAETKKIYAAKNKKAVKERQRRWYLENKERIIKNKKKRYQNDLEFRIAYTLRNRLNLAIKNNAKRGSAIRDLGCSIDELKTHLESKFVEGMSWDNYGAWHIDHIIPLSSFNLKDREQVKIACNYKNLQPLWAKDNLRKGAKIPEK